MKRRTRWAWLWVALGLTYFVLPLYGTLDFSLRAQRDTLSLTAYQSAFNDPEFIRTFTYSTGMGLLTIVLSTALMLPTAFWVHLRLPRLRPVIEMVTLLPFVIPGIVLVFGYINIYSRPLTILSIPILPPLTETILGTDLLMVAGYMVLTLPYMYRAIDNGLRAIDVRGLTEAAQSLGASWPTIVLRVILPNLRGALLSGALLVFAFVIGELILASFLARPAFGPYLALLGQHRAYEPAALTLVSFLMTWIVMIGIQILTRGKDTQKLAAGR